MAALRTARMIDTSMIAVYQRLFASAMRNVRIARRVGDDDARRDYVREAMHYRAQAYNLRVLAAIGGECV